MIDIDYGHVHIKLAKLMEKQNISISKLAFRSETQRTQLKSYIHNDNNSFAPVLISLHIYWISSSAPGNFHLIPIQVAKLILCIAQMCFPLLHIWKIRRYQIYPFFVSAYNQMQFFSIYGLSKNQAAGKRFVLFLLVTPFPHIM